MYTDNFLIWVLIDMTIRAAGTILTASFWHKRNYPTNKIIVNQINFHEIPTEVLIIIAIIKQLRFISNHAVIFRFLAPFKNAAKKQTPKKAARAGSPSSAGPAAKVAKHSPDESASTSKKGRASRAKNEDVIPTSTRDDSFREFRRLCAELSNASAYTEKTAIVKRMLTKGSEGGK